MLSRLRNIYRNFPFLFWIVVLISFVDGIGSTLLFPFFALYITQKFNVGMTQAGLLLGLSSLFGLIGSMLGGALTDKFGRRKLILFGLVASAVSMLTFGLVNDLTVLIPVAIVVGFLSNISNPAHQAMVADILPRLKRQEGFGILRVVHNMSWIIGPAAGGFIAGATGSYFPLFVTDVIISCFLAILVFRLIPETKPQAQIEVQHENIRETIAGYRFVLRDFAFTAFLATSILMMLVYQQMYNSLSVYLRDNHGIDPQGYGLLLTTSAVTVVIFQFWVTSIIKSRPPFLMIALGTIFYLIGFGMFGFVTIYPLFMTALIIITIGEMIIMPTGQTLAANFAPEEMRGRYMAFFHLSWSLPATLSPAAAGFILDNFNPNLLWYLDIVICAIAVIGFYTLHNRLGRQDRFIPAGHQAVPEDLPSLETVP